MATRRAAMTLIDAVLRQGLPLESALARATAGLDRADDRAFAHAIAADTLRWLDDLDALIDGATPKPLPHDAKARTVLRLALTQALRLGTAPHAAVATALPLVEAGPRRLVHGVLGRLLREQAVLPEIPTLPLPVAHRWSLAWGAPVVAAAARLAAAPPPIDLTLRDPAETALWVERLGGASLMPGHVRLAQPAPITGLPGFAEGAWWVQDVSAALPARLLGPGAGSVLDLCAAPGGKAMQLAAAGWRVTALDAAQSRLARLEENIARTGLTVDAVCADLLRWSPPAPADAVLLDAPCSASGIFRRHPDVLRRLRPGAIVDLAAVQATMLDRAAGWVRPGGQLVYAVCSLEPAEGERQLANFLERHPDYAIDPVLATELPAGVAPTPEGSVRMLPGMIEPEGGCDGFFVARMRRRV